MAPTPTSSSVSAAALIRRQALDNAIARQHPPIDRKVAAHHKGPHGRVLLRQPIGFVGEVGLGLPPIDEDQAGEARGTAIRFVQGISPTAASTETCPGC